MLVKWSTIGQLQRELGGTQPTAIFLLYAATAYQMSIGIIDGEGKIVFVAPHGWQKERLLGWLGVKREAIEAAVGPVHLRLTPARKECDDHHKA